MLAVALQEFHQDRNGPENVGIYSPASPEGSTASACPSRVSLGDGHMGPAVGLGDQEHRARYGPGGGRVGPTMV